MSNHQSFEPDGTATTTGPDGQRAHRSLIEHTDRLARRLWTVRDGVWCLVGNGLSNQTFVEGPGGIIAIDTGECREEMEAAIRELRTVTDRPITAVVYTHFHYVNGTTAVFDDVGAPVPVWGHAGIEGNLARVGGEVGPVARRGLIEQFGVQLPEGGPDGLVNAGLGLAYRNQAHAPFTPGFVPPDHPITEPATATVAGLEIVFHPTPSDADDNVTLWFPSLGVCVNNLVWPALFNVFAIRGEEYRDPRVLLEGLDHILALGAKHLVGAHGPPLSGAEAIEHEVEQYRDSIQFLWDQTVRAVNEGLTSAEIGARVRLPDEYDSSFLTRMHYGVAEHHARQIHAGLRGWFDGDPAALFPVAPDERAARLVAGFGGVETVRGQVDEAMRADDLRWAVELTSWLVRLPDAAEADRGRLAQALRLIGQRTTSANIRNWTLTRARELEGHLDLARHRVQTFSTRAALALAPADLLAALRVRLDPSLAAGVDSHAAFAVAGHPRRGLHVRRCVAVPTAGHDADVTVSLDHPTLAEIVSGALSFAEAEAASRARIVGDRAALEAVGRPLGLDSADLSRSR